ncbi:DUF2306 domain-containing protein [Catenovulum sp. SM1970]|uniref:DUF2306 domain-containing protein n=1 Tax=Marinifaba aquimaris TaxID=2741323 RepID=UPI001572B4BE|nr:DUF2306 domain-containing protein [Marinifaba aquimaris]NTS78480.1 DUF2306 domain-containing protein [Marinifaba aquimaris]
MNKSILWGIMVVSAIVVASYAVILLIAPAIRPPFIQNLFSNFPSITRIHLAGGAIAIVTGAWQFNTTFRQKYLSLHKLLGRFYVGAIVFSAVTGFILALNSVGGFYAQLGFGLMAIFWLVITLKAYAVIRQGDVKLHERWMIRSYAVTLAGVTLRLYLGISIVLGIQFSVIYPVLAWLCWVPNLFFAQWFISTKTKTGHTFKKQININ